MLYDPIEVEMIPLIRRELLRMGGKYAAQEAQKEIHYIGYVESEYRHIWQDGITHGLGGVSFWQLEGPTILDNIEFMKAQSHRQHLVDALKEVGFLWDNPVLGVEINIAAAIQLARLKCWRTPQPIPTERDAMFEFYKAVYNTGKGAATLERWREMTKKLDNIVRRCGK